MKWKKALKKASLNEVVNNSYRLRFFISVHLLLSVRLINKKYNLKYLINMFAILVGISYFLFVAFRICHYISRKGRMGLQFNIVKDLLSFPLCDLFFMLAFFVSCL